VISGSSAVPPLSGEIVVDNLSFIQDERALILDGVSFAMRLDEHVAIIGQGGSGKNELALRAPTGPSSILRADGTIAA
jgi:ABC-type bacteriocin/lantibiotic exporter with double-glycine peptidase domain